MYGNGFWVRTGHPAVSVNGASLSSWSFDAMNVLTWAKEAGVSSAWLQVMALPGGPVFLGSLKDADTPEDAGLPPQHTNIRNVCRYEGCDSQNEQTWHASQWICSETLACIDREQPMCM